MLSNFSNVEKKLSKATLIRFATKGKNIPLAITGYLAAEFKYYLNLMLFKTTIAPVW